MFWGLNSFDLHMVDFELCEYLLPCGNFAKLWDVQPLYLLLLLLLLLSRD